MLFCGEISLLIGGFSKKKREILRLKAYLAEGFHRLIALVGKKKRIRKISLQKNSYICNNENVENHNVNIDTRP